MKSYLESQADVSPSFPSLSREEMGLTQAFRISPKWSYCHIQHTGKLEGFAHPARLLDKAFLERAFRWLCLSHPPTPGCLFGSVLAQGFTQPEKLQLKSSSGGSRVGGERGSLSPGFSVSGMLIG